MSYCRPGDDSDVYVIAVRNANTGYNVLVCFCMRENNESFTRTGMMLHLQEHLDAGEKVPERAFDRLARERMQQGDQL